MRRDNTMIKHFVRFYSPGTFVAETTEKPIEEWNVSKAIGMVKGIKERYGATPYGFKFITRFRTDDELDSREVKDSNMYFLGGEIFTLKDLKDRNDPNDSTLISNIESNKWDRVIVNTNSWKWTQPLMKDDVVLDYQKEGKNNE
jgi:hypothetical protein